MYHISSPHWSQIKNGHPVQRSILLKIQKLLSSDETSPFLSPLIHALRSEQNHILFTPVQKINCNQDHSMAVKIGIAPARKLYCSHLHRMYPSSKFLRTSFLQYKKGCSSISLSTVRRCLSLKRSCLINLMDKKKDSLKTISFGWYSGVTFKLQLLFLTTYYLLHTSYHNVWCCVSIN